MKLKNLLLMVAVLTVLFVGCARQRPVTPPQITPQGTTLETPKITPMTTPRTTPRTTPDTRLPEVGIGPGTRTGAAVGEDTGEGMGTGIGVEAGTETGTGGSIEHGTFKGDLYISSNNFRLIDTTVKGNVYFTTDEARSTFRMDAKSKVTGRQELRR